jgi:uncharacterized protein YigE (DUF2233 family)
MKSLSALLLLLLPLLSCSSNQSSPENSRQPAGPLASTAGSAARPKPSAERQPTADSIISYTVNPRAQHLALYWKDDAGQRLRSLGQLRSYVESKHVRLLFAMNGGMFTPNFAPLGLYIQDYRQYSPLDTLSGSGNFYLKPNGVFYLSADNHATVCTTADFRSSNLIRYATQSGPMLVVDGQIHSAFKEGSANRQIRNGVGILTDGQVLFAMSKVEISFYDFAEYFRRQGCRNALYLDGFVSRMYLPDKGWRQTDGDFGVMIGVTQPVD